MPRKKIGTWQDRISWIFLFAALILTLLPRGTKIKISQFPATGLLFPLRGIAYLRNTIATLGTENQRLARLAAELALENAWLRSTLNRENATTLSYPPQTRLIRASIIGCDLATLKRFFIIARGANDGIRPGTPVISPEGIVGVVTSTSPAQSLIQTIFEPDFRVAVLNNRTREVALALPGPEGLLQLEYAAKDADFQPGDTIITSGMGGVFPKGIPVGLVIATPEKPDELFKPILIRPFARITALEQVFILLFPGQANDEWLDGLKPREITIPE